MSRRWRRCILAAGGLIVLAWGMYLAAAGWWYRAELARAKREVAAGRFGPARERLARLSAFWPGAAEVHYQLGVCEQAAGRPDRALAAWARIAPGSPFAATAARSRDEMLRQFQDRGRFAALEELLEAARRGTGPGAAAAGQTLARLLRFEGRNDEVRRLLRDEWARAPDPLPHAPRPLEARRRTGPDRDGAGRPRRGGAAGPGRRPGLARAGEPGDLVGAVRRGGPVAGGLPRAPPDDPAVWRPGSTGRGPPGESTRPSEALAHLPADRLDPAEVLELRAWFAGRRGDREAERLALERLVERAPGDARALERLATLAVEAGQADRAGALRRRKAEVDRAKDRYRKLLAIDAKTVNLPSSPGWPKTLGRWFEARGWWTLAARLRRPMNRRPAPPWTRLARRAGPRAPRPLASPTSSRPPDRCPEADAGPPRRSIPPVFTDDAEAAGLRFIYDNGRTAARQLPETMGGGVGLLDYDGDGWLDVYCVQGGPFPPEPGVDPATATASSATGATARSRTSPSGPGSPASPGGYGHGVAVGDYDNDGHPDLFVTRWRSYALLPQPGRRHVRGRHRGGRAGRRPRLADLGGLRRPGRRRRPRPLRLPLPGLGRRTIPTLCRDPTGSGEPTYCDPRRFEARARPPLPQRRRPVRRRDGRGRASSTATAGAWASSPPTSTATAGSTCTSPTT